MLDGMRNGEIIFNATEVIEIRYVVQKSFNFLSDTGGRNTTPKDGLRKEHINMVD